MQVLTLSVDTYGPSGELVGSNLAVRSSAEHVSPYDLFDAITASLPEPWKQLTYDEAVAYMAHREAFAPVTWEQLSIF